MMQTGKLFQLKIHFGDFRSKNSRGFSIPLTQRGVHQKSLRGNNSDNSSDSNRKGTIQLYAVKIYLLNHVLHSGETRRAVFSYHTLSYHRS